MALETLDNVIAWAKALQQTGVTTLANAELSQALQIIARSITAQPAWLAAHDATLATHDERLTALQATHEALAQSEDDLDIFQAGYERGYAQGWRHALDAKEEPTP